MWNANDVDGFIATLTLVVGVVLLLGAGCASTAHYPIRTIEQGEVSVSGGMHGSTEGAIPAVTGQVRYGAHERGDVGAHAAVEGYTMKSGSFGPGGLAAGLSYRHYLAPWFRLGLESTYHHTASDFSGTYAQDTMAGEFGGPNLASQLNWVDDWVDSRAVFEFVHTWDHLGVHGGPIVKTGLWLPDKGRPETNPNTGEAIGPSWLGLQYGVFGGIGFWTSTRSSVQFDTQFLPGSVATFDTGDEGTANYLSANILRMTLSANYRF